MGFGSEETEAQAKLPVVLKSHVVEVPPCENGFHGAHRVKVRVGGQGFPLVVAHGYTSESRVYLLVLGLLARWFKVIAIDLAGHGGTADLPSGRGRIEGYADLFNCTLMHLGVKKAVYVGHSLGGRVAAEAASLNPEMVAALILANSITGRPWDEMKKHNPLQALALIRQLTVDMAKLMQHLRQTDESTTLYALGFSVYRNHMRRPWRLISPGLAILNAPPSEPILWLVKENKIYTVVLWGDLDPAVSLESAQSTAEISGGHLIVVNEGGHCWPLADRRTLPQIMESELSGGLGEALDSALREMGLDPTKLTKDELEEVLYAGEALVYRLTPRPAHWLGDKQINTRPNATWQRHLPKAI